MADMHFDTAIRLAKELYKGGMDLTDIWIVGQNMQVVTCDNFWIERIIPKPPEGGESDADENDDQSN